VIEEADRQLIHSRPLNGASTTKDRWPLIRSRLKRVRQRDPRRTPSPLPQGLGFRYTQGMEGAHVLEEAARDRGR
jgi:hypothetical protein